MARPADPNPTSTRPIPNSVTPGAIAHRTIASEKTVTLASTSRRRPTTSVSSPDHRPHQHPDRRETAKQAGLGHRQPPAGVGGIVGRTAP